MFNNPDVQKYDSIDDVPVTSDTIGRVLPRQTSTGSNRGDQIVKGRILVVDDGGVVRMVLGYDKDAF
jgi:hypothetical protein